MTRSDEDRASRGPSVGSLLLVTLAVCACTCVFDAAHAISAEYRLADSLDLNDPAWQLNVSYDIPSHEQQPILVMNGSGILRYVDGASLEELTHRYLPEHGCKVSENGKFIGMCTFSTHEDSKTMTAWFHVGDWLGDRLWRMQLRPCYDFHLAGSGHSVIFPTVHPDDELSGDFFSTQWRYEPAVTRHGLLVYDAHGSLVVEDLEYAECRYSFYSQAAVSPEGRYLAFLFWWVPEEFRESRFNIEGDKACLVLYDLEAGVAVWRRYFEQQMPGGLAVGPRAERILCFLRSEVARFPKQYDMYLLDSEGKELLHKKVPRRHGLKRSLSRSAEGRVSVFVEYDHTVHVIEMCEEGLYWEWKHPADKLYWGSFGVSSDGRVAIYGKEIVGDDEGSEVKRIYIHDSDGTLIQTIPLDFKIKPEAAPVGVGISKDGNMLWMAHRSVRLYRLH